jgi:hypothetical protein
VKATDAFILGAFDLAWTTFTVLWFAQIMPKHLGAMNPDRYLDRLLRACFPVVEVVRKVGVSQPGEWIAYVLEYCCCAIHIGTESVSDVEVKSSLCALSEIRTPRHAVCQLQLSAE